MHLTRPSLRTLAYRCAALLFTVCAALLFTGCERSNAKLLRDAEAISSDAKPNFVQAQKYLDEVLDRTAGDPSPSALNDRKQALSTRGTNFRAMGLLNAAETDFSVILTQIDPKDSYALSTLAAILVVRGDTKLDENQKNDFDYAIEYAERALKISGEDGAAAVAAGLSRLYRGRFRREKVTDDIALNSTGGEIDELRKKIVVATGLPSDDSRSVALTRDLERRLELRSTDVRARVMQGIADAREDTLAALGYLRKALSTASAAMTGDAAVALLEALDELNQPHEAIVLSRIAMRSRGLRVSPPIVEIASRIFFSAALYEECARTVVEFTEKSPWPLEIATRRRALLAASWCKNAELIARAVKAFRKKTGGDPGAAAFMRVLDYYDALVVSLRGGAAGEVAKLMGAITAKLDPELSDVIPNAALLGASAQRILGSVKTRELIAVGLAANPSDVSLLLMRADLELEPNGDPLLAGKDLRKVIVQRPRDIELFFPRLRSAAQNFVSKTGRSLSTIELESTSQGQRMPTGFEEGWIYYVFARDYFSQGKYVEAASCALEALSRDSELKPAFIVLGLARAKLNEPSEARQAFERSLDAIPTDPATCQAIAATGFAPNIITLYLIASRPDVEGRLVVAESMLERKDIESAAKILTPLALQEDAPDTAKILAARLLVTRDDPAFETLLATVKPGSPAEVHASQVRLEAALKRGNVEAVKTVAADLQSHLTEIQTDRLAHAVRAARMRGDSKAAVPAARLLADATPEADIRDALDLLGHTLLESGDEVAAIEVFDRLLGITLRPEHCIWLAYALHKKGDRTGVAEALAMLRRDWGGSPFEYQRTILAVMAGVDPLPEELTSIYIGIDDPFSVVAAAAMFAVKSGRSPTPAELPRLTEWIDAALDFVGNSKERAELVLRMALCLRTAGGGVEGIAELSNIGEAASQKPFVKYLLAEAYSTIPERASEAPHLYLEAATELPDMDVAWAKALNLTLQDGREANANGIAKQWFAARPGNSQAVLASKLASCREKLRTVEDVDNVERVLTELSLQNPRDFEVALTLLRARVVARRVNDVVATAKSLVKMCEDVPSRTTRAVGPVCAMFREFLDDTLVEARVVARSLTMLLPDDWRPIELLVSCDLREQDFTDAADVALEFLRKPGRLRHLSDTDVSSFMLLLLKTNPAEAGEIAQMSVGAVPGDLARWRTFSSTLEALNQDPIALRFLRPFVKIEPSGALRGMLAELLAKPGNDPGEALTLISESPAIQENRPGVVTLEHVAGARALSLLGRSNDAVLLLERALKDEGGIDVNLDYRNAWLALAFAYATRFEPGDAVKASRILIRTAEGMGSESAARFRSMADLLVALGQILGPRYQDPDEKKTESGPSSSPANK